MTINSNSTIKEVSDFIFEQELSTLEDKNLYRKLRTLKTPGGIHAELEGKKVLLFCSNDYLGLSRHPQVLEAARQALAEGGIGAGAARLISGTSEWHAELEEKIASFKAKEKALVFPTGYLTNLGILTSLAGPEDVIVMDKLCHASLIDGARLSGATLRVFPHRRYEKCEEILAKSMQAKKRILVSETVFSMDGDQADLGKLILLKKKYDALLVVDDAHGTGVFGQTGCGATEGFSEDIDLIMGTLSKALGGLGGFAAASDTLVHYLINTARSFIFATALPPFLCRALLKSIEIVQEEPFLRKKLWDNVHQVKKELGVLGVATRKEASPIIPIIVGDEKKALEMSQRLLEAGILIPAVRYPTVPKGKARLRLTVSASHGPSEIQFLVQAFKTVRKEIAGRG